MSGKIETRAIVKVTLQVELEGRWTQKDTTEQVFRRAKNEALRAIETVMSHQPDSTRMIVIGTPIVQAVYDWVDGDTVEV